MPTTSREIDVLSVNTIRTLSADIVQKANSGHPGAPMGMAPAAYALWMREMRHNPANPDWVNRDRFVLSAGHASALLYSLLHLFQYGLSMEDLQQFRQWGSKTPGHPEYGHTVGVEVTTGPLGQGIANAVGFALAEARLAAQFNRPGFPVVDHWTYALCGDGCMMEGIAGEAASLAGTLALGKLVVLYDDNEISIEGDTDIAFREDVGARFEAYGWRVLRVQNGNDYREVARALAEARGDASKPTLIVVPTQIGFGCAAKQGKASAHGEPLGAENLAAAKAALGMPAGDFEVLPEVRAHFGAFQARGREYEGAWHAMFARYAAAHPDLAREWERWFGGELPDLASEESLWAFEGKAASRNSSGEVLNRLAKIIPNLIGGSADLAPSNKSDMKGAGSFSAENRAGSNLHYGVREHAMAAIANGIAAHGGLRTYAATFFVFSDYMKNAMRMSALMKLPVTYILTHDSIGVGEDGPTHQPVEHLAGLRAVPDLLVFRPADSREVTAGWVTAMTAGLPTCLVLSRQDLPLYPGSGKQALRGGYIVSDSKAAPQALLLASGSEVEQMVQAQAMLWERGVDARVISLPCLELFEAQDAAYREGVMPAAVRARVAMEAGVSACWYRYVGLDGAVIGIDHYGASAPASRLFKEFGLTAERAVEETLRVLKQLS
ncbi:MAG: transketolase [Clostridia bacterium]|nr:transketolase [Clostridia bacterium]